MEPSELGEMQTSMIEAYVHILAGHTPVEYELYFQDRFVEPISKDGGCFRYWRKMAQTDPGWTWIPRFPKVDST